MGTRQPPLQASPPHLDGGMKYDPRWANVAALEIFNEQTGEAVKAPIFSVDVLNVRAVPDTAATVEDALAISIDQYQRIDIAYIAELLGTDQAAAAEQLRGLAYPSLDDPDELVPAATALSGNVREKLAAATAAAERDPAYQDYVTALRDVVPRDKEASQIKTRPGAPWIDAKYVAQFARETFGADTVVADHVGGTWSVECARYQRGIGHDDRNLGAPHTKTPSSCSMRCATPSRSPSTAPPRRKSLKPAAPPASTSRPPSPPKPKPPRSPRNSRNGSSMTRPAARNSSPSSTSGSTALSPRNTAATSSPCRDCQTGSNRTTTNAMPLRG